jgi:hypothetical protein
VGSGVTARQYDNTVEREGGQALTFLAQLVGSRLLISGACLTRPLLPESLVALSLEAGNNRVEVLGSVDGLLR